MINTEKLIESIKQHRILFDLRHPDYKNNAKKAFLWAELSLEYNCTGRELKQKWKNLKDTYMKYLKCVKSLAAGRNCNKNYRNWQWAKNMEYFRPYICYSEVISTLPENAGQDKEETDSNDSDVQEDPLGACTITITDILGNAHDAILPETEEVSCPPTTKTLAELFKDRPSGVRPLKRKMIEPELAATSTNVIAVNRSVHSLDSEIQEKDNNTALEHLFLAYAKTVQTFSPYRQATAKMRIAQIIGEEEIKNLTEAANGPMSTVSRSTDDGIEDDTSSVERYQIADSCSKKCRL